MIITKDSIAKASPKTKRAIRYEYELEHIALLDCVFSANNTREFRLLMEARVLADARFERLPAYRQVALDAYVRGCLDTLAHQQGLSLSEAPDAVQPKPRIPSFIPAASITKRPSARAPRIAPTLGAAGTSFPNVFDTFREKVAARTIEGADPLKAGAR